MDLNEARAQIRSVDLQMRDLFLQRMEAVRAVAEWKKQRGLPVEDREQEKNVISGLSPAVEDETLRSLYICFIQDTMNISKQWQHHLLDGLPDGEGHEP